MNGDRTIGNLGDDKDDIIKTRDDSRLEIPEIYFQGLSSIKYSQRVRQKAPRKMLHKVGDRWRQLPTKEIVLAKRQLTRYAGAKSIEIGTGAATPPPRKT